MDVSGGYRFRFCRCVYFLSPFLPLFLFFVIRSSTALERFRQPSWCLFVCSGFYRFRVVVVFVFAQRSPPLVRVCSSVVPTAFS